jgi:hypothetical protein
MGMLAISLLVLMGIYLLPQRAPNRRWLALFACIAVAAALAAWFGWVARQGDALAAGIAGMMVMLCLIAAAMGLSVRALVLWRGWQGGRMAAAVGIGGAVLVVGMTFLLRGAFWR